MSQCNRTSHFFPHLQCSRGTHTDAEECMYTEAAFVQATARMMTAVDQIEDPATREALTSFKNSLVTNAAVEERLQEVAAGDVVYATDGSFKSVQ